MKGKGEKKRHTHLDADFQRTARRDKKAFLSDQCKTVPKKKRCKKEKRLFEEALQIADERRETKGKGERERYTHLNVEFQRTARRGKKAFLSKQ